MPPRRSVRNRGQGGIAAPEVVAEAEPITPIITRGRGRGRGHTRGRGRSTRNPATNEQTAIVEVEQSSAIVGEGSSAIVKEKSKSKVTIQHF